MGKLSVSEPSYLEVTLAVPELLRISNHSRSFPWRGNRSAILDALAQIAPENESVLALLRQTAAHESDPWRYAATKALEEISDETRSTNAHLATDAVQSVGDASKCVGTYKGRLQLGGGFTEVETRLFLCQTDPGKLCGDYIMHVGYPEYGELIQQRHIADRKLWLEWSDSSGSGLLELVFNDDFTEFEGVYGDGLSWNGVR